MPASQVRKVKVNLRSGFDKHFRNTLTANVGTLVPIFFDEVIPNTSVHLKLDLASALPPLVSDTYMNVKLRVEAFAVPLRLLSASFESFFCDYPDKLSDSYDFTGPDYDDVTSLIYDVQSCVPLIQLWDSSATLQAIFDDFVGRGSLTDYLGYDIDGDWDSNDDVNVLPFICYHFIWQEWYRNPRVQKPAFLPDFQSPLGRTGQDVIFALNLPYYHCSFNGVHQPTLYPAGVVAQDEWPLYNYCLADGKCILELRQRNFDLDYFTGALVEPQQGEKAKVNIVDGGFTIESLRAQNSIQQFRERNGLTSPRFQQQNYARYGVAPSDGVLQRPALIGAASYDVYSHGVTQTSNSDSGVESNPFNKLLGARGGNGFAAGSDMLIKGFVAKEPMYIMVLASLVPDVTYSQGYNPVLKRYIGKGSIADMANPILQNVGPDKIYTRELYNGPTNTTFAYKDRYADWMIMKNQCHGEFKKSGTLSNFVLQRYFSDAPEFGSEFLEIPTDFLDAVLAINSSEMGFAYWLDIMFDYKVSQPLQEYSIPSLQDPGYEHGRTIKLRKNGALL